MQASKVLFWTSRPVSWVNTAYPFAAGYLLMGGGIDWRLIVGTLFFLIPYNLLMYGVNDVYDYESDIRNPRKGSVEGAITPKKYHPLILWSSFGSTIPFVVVLSVGASWASILALVAVLFFVVAYSLKGLRFKEIPFLDSITSSIHFVGPLVYAFTLVGSTDAGWIAALAFFAWGIGSQAFGAVQDVVPDREAGIRSIATILGARRTVRFAFLMYLLASVFVASIGGTIALVVAFVGLIYAENVWPYISVTDKKSGAARKGWRRFMWLNYIAGAVITICFMIPR